MSQLAFTIFVHKSIGILAAVLYGMIAVWAVRSRWHWFARVAVVGGSLAALLALPYFEWAIQFGAAILVFAAGFAFWQRREGGARDSQALPATHRKWPRLSLRDVFLFTIVVAAILAVFVNAPKRGMYAWLFTIIDGAMIASIGLACAWLAVGRARLAYRLLAAPLIIAYGIAVTYFWINRLSGSFASYFTGTRTFDVIWSNLWRRFVQNWSRDLDQWTLPVALSIAAFTVWLKLASASKWFSQTADPAADNTPADARVSRCKRQLKWAFVITTLVLAVPPVYVWQRLVTPRPLPPEAFASNDGYRELVVVVNELYKVNGGDIKPWTQQASDAQIAALVARDAPLWRRVRAAIDEGCQFPWQIPPKSNEDGPFRVFAFLMIARAVRGDGTDALEPRIEACLDAIRLAQMETRSSAPPLSGDFARIDWVENSLWNMRAQLTTQQCKEISQALWQVDQQRESWEELINRSRWIKQHAGWWVHYDVVVADFTGWNDDYHHLRAMMLRMLIVELGIRAFELEKGSPPTTLAELVPAYLEKLPDDPFGNGPLKYQFNGDSYILYSFGPNGIDDGGQFIARRRSGDWLGDIPLDRIFNPPRPARPQAGTSPVPNTEQKTKNTPQPTNNK